jgi:hypothetical protein
MTHRWQIARSRLGVYRNRLRPTSPLIVLSNGNLIAIRPKPAIDDRRPTFFREEPRAAELTMPHRFKPRPLLEVTGRIEGGWRATGMSQQAK